MLKIKIVDGENLDLWVAEVTPPQGNWRSPQPMPWRELDQILTSMGFDKDELMNARIEAYVEDSESAYRRLEKEYLPFLQATLAGEREVPPPQRRFIEAWMAYALYYRDEIRPLWNVLYRSDAVFHSSPSCDELSWAFLRLRERGWLAVDGDRFGLTPEGSHIVRDVLSQDDDMYWYVLIERWMSEHPLPGDENAEIWKSETKVFDKNAESEYRRLEKEYLPFLQAALAGERGVLPPQRLISEAWVAYALYRLDGIRPLWEVIRSADDLFINIPDPDKLSWAFLRLRERGWLAVDGDRFGLTSKGRRVIRRLKRRYKDMHWWEPLQNWMSDHPLPGDE
ncbi:hypothetical protein [Methanomassiliicoccus luminyensis]|uniref:hypothetical protein n=1 Tax=Methanomassiliicoccus luminyensis TaxID=1080712 RepID=UPI00038255FE|nr:hypothetical protein [Methanomassiliicoccus luminyensis]